MRSREEKRRERLALVRAFEQANMTRVEYCQRHGITTGTFDHWRRRARNEDVPEPSGKMKTVAKGLLAVVLSLVMTFPSKRSSSILQSDVITSDESPTPAGRKSGKMKRGYYLEDEADTKPKTLKKIRATKSQAIVDESILLPDRRWCSPERNPLQSAIDLHTRKVSTREPISSMSFLRMDSHPGRDAYCSRSIVLGSEAESRRSRDGVNNRFTIAARDSNSGSSRAS